MSDGRASKTLDDLLAVLLEDDAIDGPGMVDAEAKAEMKAMVDETSALIEKLHRERTTRRLAAVEEARNMTKEWLCVHCRCVCATATGSWDDVFAEEEVLRMMCDDCVRCDKAPPGARPLLEAILDQAER